MKPKLFLLKPDFTDPNINSDTIKYFCPDCVFIEGLLSYYPFLRTEIEIQYIDFKKPRIQIIEVLGENYQSCPSLIIEDSPLEKYFTAEFIQHNKILFSNNTKTIAKYFNAKFGIGVYHP